MKWNIVKLGDYINILSGYPFESNLFNESNGTPVIRIRDVKRGFTNTYYKGKVDSNYLITKGDILVGMDGEFNTARWSSEPALLNQRVCKITSKDKSKLSEDYLIYFLPKKLKEIEDRTSFATVKHLSVKGINNIEIPLPPLHIQEQIADTLDKADALRRKDQELLQKYDQLAQAIFYDMFGDPVRNERGWESGSIEEYFELINGDRSENYPTTEDFVESGVPFFGTNDMKEIFLSEKVTRFLSEEKFNSLGRGKLKYDDLVITLRGSLGNICLFRSKKHNTGFINAQMMILRGKREVDHLFSTFVFQSKEYKRLFERITGGSAVPQITSKQVSKLPFIYPPVSKQREFSQALIKCINSKNNLTAFTEKSFFKTLIAKMF